MAKILMIQLTNTPYVGTAYLHGAARSAGHEFALYVGRDEPAIFQQIEQHQPDIIGFSCMTGIHVTALELAAMIKKRTSIPIILGGPHPTLFPDVIDDPNVDMICRGEGEFALIDLLNALDEKRSPAGIANLWVKESGELHKADIRPLPEVLDDVPMLDWTCYRDTPVQQSAPVAFPVRGCPFSCSFCFNAKFRELYNVTPKKYVRHLSVERAIAEIKAALEVFAPNPVLFTSDTFGVDLPWMDHLLRRYSEEFDLPFVLLLRPEYVSEKLVAILAQHKCHAVAIGVESGSERVRREVLNRKYPNKLLYEVADRLHGAGIKFRTYNMIGLPTETEDEMWETIDVNIRMKADYPKCSVFIPLPGTKLTQMALDLGQLDPSFDYNTVPISVLSPSVLKNVDGDLILNTMYLFQTAIRFPMLRSVMRRMTHMKPNMVFRYWFYALYAMLHRKSENRRLLPYIRYVFANRKYV